MTDAQHYHLHVEPPSARSIDYGSLSYKGDPIDVKRFVGETSDSAPQDAQGEGRVKRIVSAHDVDQGSVETASQTLLAAAQKVGQRIIDDKHSESDGALALALVQAANGAKDLETWDRAGFRR